MTSGRWSSSSRRTQLPPDWRTHVRPRILARDPTCRLGLNGCTEVSTDVDHIDDPEDHDDANLRGLCASCHKQVTQRQAQAARIRRKRPSARHPGLA